MPAVVIALLVVGIVGGGIAVVASSSNGAGDSLFPDAAGSPTVGGGAGNSGPACGYDPNTVRTNAQNSAASGAQSGGVYGAVIGWFVSIGSQFGSAVGGMFSRECREERQAFNEANPGVDKSGTWNQTLANRAAERACKDGCNESFENHNLIGPGGRPWRDCRHACEDAPPASAPDRGFLTPG